MFVILFLNHFFVQLLLSNPRLRIPCNSWFEWHQLYQIKSNKSFFKKGLESRARRKNPKCLVSQNNRTHIAKPARTTYGRNRSWQLGLSFALPYCADRYATKTRKRRSSVTRVSVYIAQTLSNLPRSGDRTGLRQRAEERNVGVVLRDALHRLLIRPQATAHEESAEHAVHDGGGSQDISVEKPAQ